MITVNCSIALFFLGMLILAVYSIPKIKIKKEFLAIENTNATKGIAILMIILAHIMQYAGNSVTVIGGGTKGVVFSFGSVGVAVFFFLSGYGNYLSLSKRPNRRAIVKTVLLQVVRLFALFVVCFLLVIIVGMIERTVFGQGPAWSADTVLQAFLSLRMPDTSTWYLKIQILLYGFSMFAFIVSAGAYRNILLLILSVAYIFIAVSCGLPNYWWQTALCYPVGAIFAEHKQYLEKAINLHPYSGAISVTLLAGNTYVLIMISAGDLIPLRVIAYVGLSAGLSVISNILDIRVPLLREIGKCSLPLYLIHIGLVIVFLSNPSRVNIQCLAFLFLTAILSILARIIDRNIVTFNKKQTKT